MATLEQRLSALITAIGTDYKRISGLIGSGTDLTGLNTTNKTSLVAAINEVNNKPSGTGGASIADGDAGTSLTTTYSAKKITDLNNAQNTTISGKANSTHNHTLADITDAATKANDVAVVHLTGNETIAGNKTLSGTTTFSIAPVVPDNSFTVAKVNGLQTALNAKATLDDAALTTDAGKTWSAKKTFDSYSAAILALETKLVGGAGQAYDTFIELRDLMLADDTETAGILTALGQRLKVDGSAQVILAANQTIARNNIGAQEAAQVGNTDADLVALYTTAKA